MHTFFEISVFFDGIIFPHTDYEGSFAKPMLFDQNEQSDLIRDNLIK